MANLKLGDRLYNKLPNIYRKTDAQIKGNHKYPLKRFLQIAGAGFDFLEQRIDDLSNIYDIDKCPPEFLSKIVEGMGFKFPYALPENEQRRFVKMLPYLYKTKGTVRSFEYLAREIFGTKSSTKAYKAEYKEGMSPEEWRKIYVDITTDGEQLNLGRKEIYFRRFAELVRPVNTILIFFLTTFYDDFYDLRGRAWDCDYCEIEDIHLTDDYAKSVLEDEQSCVVEGSDVDKYSKEKISEEVLTDTMIDEHEEDSNVIVRDAYSGDIMEDSFIETELYRYKLFIDGVEVDMNKGHKLLLNNFILNSSTLYNGEKVEYRDKIVEGELPCVVECSDLESIPLNIQLEYEEGIELKVEDDAYKKIKGIEEISKVEILDSDIRTSTTKTEDFIEVEILGSKNASEVEDTYKRKYSDGEAPFTLNVSNLNDLKFGLSEFSGYSVISYIEDGTHKEVVLPY